MFLEISNNSSTTKNRDIVRIRRTPLNTAPIPLCLHRVAFTKKFQRSGRPAGRPLVEYQLAVASSFSRRPNRSSSIFDKRFNLNNLDKPVLIYCRTERNIGHCRHALTQRVIVADRANDLSPGWSETVEAALFSTAPRSIVFPHVRTSRKDEKKTSREKIGRQICVPNHEAFVHRYFRSLPVQFVERGIAYHSFNFLLQFVDFVVFKTLALANYFSTNMETSTAFDI